MNKPTRNTHLLFKIANDALVDLPTPSTISGWWNFGSLLGICLVIQIVTGLFLAIHYCSNIDTAFDRVRHICRDVKCGWLLRTIHANGASLFFNDQFLFQLMHHNFTLLTKSLYMFRAPTCPSSGGQTIHAPQLVQLHLLWRLYGW